MYILDLALIADRRLSVVGAGRCPDSGAVYGACSPERGLILLCGVSERDLEQTSSSSSSSSCGRGGKVSDQFPRYSRWRRLQYDVERSVLTDTLGALMSARSIDVNLLQTTARCEVRDPLAGNVRQCRSLKILAKNISTPQNVRASSKTRISILLAHERESLFVLQRIC